MADHQKAYDFWRNRLKACRHILAPMVDQSELAFRLLVRQYYGVECAYTPMINANSFLKNTKYRNLSLQTCPEDRPLILQFCANNSDILLEAAKMVVNLCDAIDINLGCPQAIAKRGHYGAFLMDDWDLIYDMINRLSTELQIPITCKIRIFPELDKSVEFAKMLEKAGVSMICVHGRRREQKGPLTGRADWDYIKAIKNAVNIPVLANGNILSLSDVDNCLEKTGVEGVISAEGLLHNPALFTDIKMAVWTVAEQYLKLARQYPCPVAFIRGHIFKFFHHCFSVPSNVDLREMIAKTKEIDVFDDVTQQLKDRYEETYKLEAKRTNNWTDGTPLPPYICQPYLRPEPKLDDPSVSIKRVTEEDIDLSQMCESDECKPKLSKKKLKRMNRAISSSGGEIGNEPTVVPMKRILCALCPNPKGEKCDYNICRTCCRKKTYAETLDCQGHKFLMKTRFDKKCQNINTLNT